MTSQRNVRSSATRIKTKSRRHFGGVTQSLAKMLRQHAAPLSAPAAVRTEPPGHAPETPCHSPGRAKCPTEARQTVRLTLSLFEPDDRNFPEFCYSQLVEDKESAEKLRDNETRLTQFEEEEKRENDELAEIARKLEQKYGSKPKKKKDRVQDLIDMGFGYDDEDSFIDNSEAYDEFVPSSITTKFGGFYINSGVLQFRDVSDTESNGAPVEEGTHKKKRKLNGQMRPKNKRCKSEETDEVQRPKSNAEIRPGIGLKKKKKKMTSTLSVTNMLKRFQREKEHKNQRLEKASDAGRTLMPIGPADAGGGGDPILSLLGSTNDQELIKAASTVDFDIDLDTLLNVTEGISSPSSQPGSDKTEDQNQASTLFEIQAQPEDDLPEGSSVETQVLQSTLPLKDLPLPEGLPPELEDNMRKLLRAAKTSEGASKLKFFTPEINTVLLDVELQCQQNGPLRSRVYSHLSSYLPCSRETLLKRVRKLLLKHSEKLSDAIDPVQRLKEAIARSMPDQIASFQESCQAFEQAKVLKEMEDKDDNVEQKAVKRSGPRKLFKWNEEIRECLRGVIRAKMELFKSENAGSQEVEEALKVLIENHIKPLWPKGWMQSGALMRESRKATELFASSQFSQTRRMMALNRSPPGLLEDDL
ncbi:ubinuclein-1 isoform 1-T1 [Synchiropus picturatus]